MTIQANKPLHLPMLVGGIIAILVSGIAIASLAISVKGVDGVAAPTEPAQAAAAPVDAAPAPEASAYYRCSGCGVITSTREIDTGDETAGANAPGRSASGKRAIGAKLLRNYEIVIRLRDGSTRVVRDANPAKWRRGERVTVIAGAD